MKPFHYLRRRYHFWQLDRLQQQHSRAVRHPSYGASTPPFAVCLGDWVERQRKPSAVLDLLEYSEHSPWVFTEVATRLSFPPTLAILERTLELSPQALPRLLQGRPIRGEDALALLQQTVARLEHWVAEAAPPEALSYAQEEVATALAETLKALSRFFPALPPEAERVLGWPVQSVPDQHGEGRDPWARPILRSWVLTSGQWGQLLERLDLLDPLLIHGATQREMPLASRRAILRALIEEQSSELPRLARSTSVLQEPELYALLSRSGNAEVLEHLCLQALSPRSQQPLFRTLLALDAERAAALVAQDRYPLAMLSREEFAQVLAHAASEARLALIRRSHEVEAPSSAPAPSPSTPSLRPR